MRLHTNAQQIHILLAARVAKVDVVSLSLHTSRSRERAFEVKLEGASRRRPNGGPSGVGSGYAATWDQWGVFLSVLYDVDHNMICGTAKHPVYRDSDHFDHRTNHRFEPHGIVTRETAGSFAVAGSERDGTDPDRIVYRVAGSYWPADAHGDHRFEFAGIPFEQSCRKCSAVTRWER